MKIIKESGKWIVAVSGGPDSMALLHLCYVEKLDVVVAHVNYNKRESATRDMNGVISFCKSHRIPYEVIYYELEQEGNFQANARNFRYQFFSKLCMKYKAKGVLVAHHKDDLLETYLMQKERKGFVQYYGIKEEIKIHDCLVKRPLLAFTKKDLIDYCTQHNVPFYIDESNYTTHYRRNYIRNCVLNHKNDLQIRKLYEELECSNKKMVSYQNIAMKILQEWNCKVTHLLLYSKDEICFFLQYWIKLETGKQVSKRECETIHQMLKQNKNITRVITSKKQLILSYGQLSIVDIEFESYFDQYDSLWFGSTKYYRCEKEGNPKDGICILPKDFPIIIRNARKSDRIKLKYGTKKVHRWFIDKKIPLDERKQWPVIENCQGNIIFVAKLGCDIEHFSNNMNLFVIK